MPRTARFVLPITIGVLLFLVPFEVDGARIVYLDPGDTDGVLIELVQLVS